MKRKWAVILSIAIVIIACAAVGIYCKLGEDERRVTFEFRKVDLLYLHAIRPILWVCVGVLAGLLTGLGKRMPAMLRRIAIIVNSAVVLAVICAVALWACNVNAKWVHTVISLWVLHPKGLVIPGLVYGCCIKL